MKALLHLLGKTALLILALILVGAILVYSGSYNVAATAEHTKLVEWILRTAMIRSVASHARAVTPPPNFNAQDRALAQHAAGHYEMMCRTCHGAPGKKPDPWKLYPAPTDLIKALQGTKWTDSEVFWILKHGIKDTGMSAFGGSHDDEDLWALTAFVRQLPAITPEQYREATEHAAMSEPSSAHSEHHSHTSEPTPPPKQ